MAWWSPGSSRRGGVGIVITCDFKSHFNKHEWIITVPGRAAVLRLGGPGGAVDLSVNYFATGTPSIIQTSEPVSGGRSHHGRLR